MAKERKIRNWIKNNIWAVFALVHFALSFLYERFIITFDSSSWELYWSAARIEKYGNTFQSAVLYCYGKLTAAVLICLIWYVVWLALKGKIAGHILVMFGIITIVTGMYFYFFIPSSFSWKDSYTLYGYAVRLIPWYWHHFLTSAWYLGCVMVFPHPLMISAVQFAGFTAMLMYLYYRLEKSFKLSRLKNMLIFLIYLAPETFSLIAVGYRNCIYAIILMFYVTFLIMEKNDRAEGSRNKLIIVCFLSALLSVWRTEGALIGITGILLSLFSIYELRKRQKLIWLVVFAAFFIMLSAPQKIGDRQYYGKDYFISSTIEPVKNILNDKNANLNYEGAEADLESIIALAPVEYIRYDGRNSVSAYFYQQGNIDFNQTLKSEQIQGEYLRAVFRLAVHNLPVYIKTQLNMALGSLNIPYGFEMDRYEGEELNCYYEYTVDRIGEQDYMRLTLPLVNNSFHNTVGEKLALVRIGYRNKNDDIGITAVLRLLILLADLVIFIRELVMVFRKKKDKDIVCLFMAFLFLVQFAIVVMTIPMVLDMYFFSVFYPCLVMECIYLYRLIGKKSGLSAKTE